MENIKIESNLRNLQKVMSKNHVSLTDQIASESLKRSGSSYFTMSIPFIY